MRPETENNLLRLLELARRRGDTNLTASVGEVTGVDPEKWTIDIRDGGLEIYNVRLNAIAGEGETGLTIVPKVGSAVIYIPIDQSLTTCYCMAFSEIDHIVAKEIKLNEGEYGGLIKINDLTEKLNSLVETVNQLKDDFNAHTHICASPGGPSKTPDLPSTASAERFSVSDYEDTQIIH